MNTESMFHCQTCIKQAKIETMETILQWYKQTDHNSCFQSLKSHNNKKRTPIHEAALVGRKDVVELLLNICPESLDVGR